MTTTHLSLLQHLYAYSKQKSRRTTNTPKHSPCPRTGDSTQTGFTGRTTTPPRKTTDRRPTTMRPELHQLDIRRTLGPNHATQSTFKSARPNQTFLTMSATNRKTPLVNWSATADPTQRAIKLHRRHNPHAQSNTTTQTPQTSHSEPDQPTEPLHAVHGTVCQRQHCPH